MTNAPNTDTTKPSLLEVEELCINIIGAGGIVNTAHLPAYKIAGYKVVGITDIDVVKAQLTATNFNIKNVYASVAKMVATANENTIYDIAVPANEIINILHKLPNNAAVLIQKPMGENLEAAKKIVEICKTKNLRAAINFQLRYAPFIVEAKKMIANNLLGDIVDVEINVNVFTPWHLWDFLFTANRVEMLYHSIHYIDLVRTVLGNPKSVYAKTTKHSAMKKLASVKSNIIMDYGDYKSANILTNHCHDFGKQKQQSYIKIEGTKGAIKINFGALIEYPNGIEDKFEFVILEEGKEPIWQEKNIKGSWFPHAFIGSMEQVMLASEGKIAKPDNSVEDCIHTMACVEAAYISSEQGGIKWNDL